MQQWKVHLLSVMKVLRNYKRLCMVLKHGIWSVYGHYMVQDIVTRNFTSEAITGFFIYKDL